MTKCALEAMLYSAKVPNRRVENHFMRLLLL
jgi:hypothetical protein